MRNGPYELVIAPPEYPGKKYRDRYCYEHHLVYWQTHGVVPGPGETIHHIDGHKRNNAPENLELLTTSEHAKHHNNERREREGIKHGGWSAHRRYKCRCDVCIAWWTAYKAREAPKRRAWRERRKLTGLRPS